jgi:hypothetical protein
LGEAEKYRGDVNEIKKSYDPDSVAQEYENLFGKLMRKK